VQVDDVYIDTITRAKARRSPMTTMQPELMQVRAAARELGVHENTLRRWEEAGLINAVRLPSGVRRFRVEDVTRVREEMYASTDEGLTAAKKSSAGRARANA
jgi:transposase-like protein